MTCDTWHLMCDTWWGVAQRSKKWIAQIAALLDKMPSVGQFSFWKYGKIPQNTHNLDNAKCLIIGNLNLNCMFSCPMIGQFMFNCPIGGQCMSNCGIIGHCIFNCPRVRQCVSNCPIVGQWMSNCPIIGQCIFNCLMVGERMSNCPIVGQCIFSCPMILQCIQLSNDWTVDV